MVSRFEVHEQLQTEDPVHIEWKDRVGGSGPQDIDHLSGENGAG
jgi:hypothetical protein